MQRTAVITGVARGRGIGLACVRQLDADGFTVVGMDAFPLEAAAAAAWPAGAVFLQCDIGARDEVLALPRRLVELGVHTVCCLINNAGIADPYMPAAAAASSGSSSADLLLQAQFERFDRCLTVNLAGAFYVTSALAPLMTPGETSIIHICSTRALQSEPHSEGYAAAKAGLVGLTHAQAASLAGTARVNAVLPGWIDTEEAVQTVPVGAAVQQADTTGVDAANASGRSGVDGTSADASWVYSPGIHRRDHDWHWVGRVGVPGDVAQLCSFLADGRRSGFITGQQFVVDGGVTRRMVYPSE